MKLGTKALVLVACTALLFLAMPLAAGTETTQVVHPTGSYPLDVQNVRDAVTRGGLVILKATDTAGQPVDFDFGPNVDLQGGSVLLISNVQITGERVGARMTTIRGGYIPFVAVIGRDTKIHGISFEAPQRSAVRIMDSTGTEITGNRIAGVPGVVVAPGRTVGRGIELLGFRNRPSITGKVLIANNVIEDMPDAGIVLNTVDADVEIRGNRIRNVQSGGGIVVFTGRDGLTRISDNIIRPGRDNEVYTWRDGIDVVGSFGGTYHITGNTILCENWLADGIFLAGYPEVGAVDNAIIERNRVTMQSVLDGGAIVFYDSVNGTAVRQNHVKGEGSFAISLLQFAPEGYARRNTFVGNEISLFHSAMADVFLGEQTSETVLAGYSGSVVDLGIANRITGFSLVPDSGFGRQIGDVMGHKLDVLTSGMSPEALP